MFFVTLIAFIFVLGVLVFIHELGHYMAAKWAGVKVEEFAIGMGPKVWGVKRGEEEFNIRALPIGGFVKMYGEGDYDIVAPDSFAGQKPWKRLIILVAGVTMNIILAFFIFFLQGMMSGFSYPVLEGTLSGEEYRPWFGKLTPEYIAINENAISETSPLNGKINGIETVISVNGESYNSNNFRDIIEENKGKKISLELRNIYGTDTREITVVPRTEHPENEGPLGIITFRVGYSEYEGIGILFSGVGQTLNNVQTFGFSINYLFDKAFEQQSIAPVAEGVGGAVSIFTILESMLTVYGLIGLLVLMGVFSINLAIINILPIPALDGGHVLFTLIEMVLRRKLPTKIYNYLTIGGFTFLMGLMLIITFVDVIRHTGVGDVFCTEERKWLGGVCDVSGSRTNQ